MQYTTCLNFLTFMDHPPPLFHMTSWRRAFINHENLKTDLGNVSENQCETMPCYVSRLKISTITNSTHVIA